MTAEAFQQAVSCLREQLKTQALRYLNSTDEAEDAVQDTLLRLWQMHEKLNPPIDGLAAVVLRNVCIDRIRRQHPIDLDSSCLAMNDETTEATDHERIEQVMGIVDGLPDTQQALLRLRHMQGMEMDELASRLQMSEVAVRKALSRARMAVRKQYLRKLVAASVAAAMVWGAWWLFHQSQQQQDEFVAIIYGQRTTDKEVVMREVTQSAMSMTEITPNAEVESQLSEMFGNE